MRIMLLAPEMIDTHTQRFIEMLLGAGYFVTCVAKDNPKPEGAERFTFINSPEVYLPKWVRPQRLRRALTEWGIALHLRYIWLKAKPDIAHVLFINSRAYHCALARLSPLVLTALGSDINVLFETHNHNSDRRKKISRALLAANYVTADTHEILDRCEILTGRPLNSALFYFGIDLNLFKSRSAEEKLALRQKLGIPLESKVILSPRRLTPQMKHELVLKAFAEFRDKSGLDVVLIFRRFGFLFDSVEIALRELAENLRVVDQVFWVDEMDYINIPILYSLADVVINIPEQDGLPVTLFEVSACMAPVITSDLPSYQEFLSEGAYFRVLSQDVNEIADAIQKVLSESRQTMINNLLKNHNLVAEKASQEKCFLGIEQIYQGLGKFAHDK